MEKFKIAIPIILVIVFTGLMLLCSQQLKTTKLFSFSQNEYVNFQFNYQLLLLLITLLSLAATYYLNKENFLNYFKLGDISATAKEFKLFGIKANDSWLKTGISLTIFISLATAAFMYFQLKQAELNWALLQSGVFWILLFSLSNSFGEEMIFRMGIVSPLKGLLSPMPIFIISAVLFGIPHLAGMPSGFIGATMAGVLGLVLAKSLYETNGFFWAWTIHFIQDVIIIGTLFLMATKK
ncbi:MAG TPA: CPBP family intramembrane metalloprotease [Bacteroidia bacterium]|nr:CPBP family intramembrane metalloprotease [Bacteroidia bacterium]